MTRPGRPGALTWTAVLAAGLVIALDGALRGEPRHRAAAVALGAFLALPALVWLAAPGGRVGRGAARLVQRLALSLVVLAIGVGALEVVVRVFDVPAFSSSILVRDPILGHAHAPRLGGLDAWGFRNPAVPLGRVDVVCVGDSQTYGHNLPPELAFPRQLAVLTGLDVYGMSAGGYGPLQYLALTERALDLEPTAIVIGLYLGNDLGDAYRFAVLDHWAEFRDERLSYPLLEELDHGDDRSLNLGMALIDGLMAKSRVLRSVGDRVKLEVKLRRYGVDLAAGEASAVDGWPPRAIATRLTPRYRRGILDLARPEIAKGLEVTEECFRRIAALATARGVRPYVLLIHNKEAYYAEVAERTGTALAPDLASLAAAERIATARVQAAAVGAGLGWIDPTERIVGALVAGRAVFPADEDAHLGPLGAALVAEALAAELSPNAVLPGGG